MLYPTPPGASPVAEIIRTITRRVSLKGSLLSQGVAKGLGVTVFARRVSLKGVAWVAMCPFSDVSSEGLVKENSTNRPRRVSLNILHMWALKAHTQK